MFERYTERARRVVFFARYEAAQFGSTTIETEHFLLGLIREDKNITNRFLRNSWSIDSIRQEIEGRTTIREKVSTSHDLPLSDECKRIIAYAAEEAERLGHRHIGTEHLLLGILREEQCVAAQFLQERGLRLNTIREELSRSAVDNQAAGSASPPNSIPENIMVPNGDTARLIAEAIWLPVYGSETIARQSPVDAALVKFKIWRVVAGSLFAFIRMKDGRVLSMGQTEETNV